MMSHSPHTNLSLGIVNISYTSCQYQFYGGKFCHLRKSIDNDTAHQKTFPTFWKMCPKSSKAPVKEFIFLVKLQA